VRAQVDSVFLVHEYRVYCMSACAIVFTFVHVQPYMHVDPAVATVQRYILSRGSREGLRTHVH
jgi:hypothetical protein